MAAGTKIRTLSRLLDASPSPVWAIGPSGKLAYLSAAASTWLGIDVDLLLDRRSIAGAPISDDPLDFVAASLSPPPGFAARGTASLRVHPPAIDGRKILPLDVRFVRIGAGDQAITLAIAGDFDDAVRHVEIQDAVALRKRLDLWRKRHTNIATIATAGVSSAARRMRARLQVAASTRWHVGFFGPAGCGASSIATRLHHVSAPDESITNVDGTLMDAELLDATLTSTINRLAESKSATATVLVNDLDDTPIEAQQRLTELLATFPNRLRLLALCSHRPKELAEPFNETDEDENQLAMDEDTSVGLHPKLIEAISGLTVTIHSLSERVEDIPVLATAALDARHAAGEGVAERFSRAALDALVIYPWPGNYEELDAAVRQAILAAPHESIGVEHLPLVVRTYRPGANPVLSKLSNVTLDEAVRRYEMRIIQDALQASDGNRAETARQLGISRARLLRKLDGDE